jgi:pimeloyl-ACP methyl ester carboxylesterase
MKHPDYRELAQALRDLDDGEAGAPLPFPDAGVEVYSLPFHSGQAPVLVGHQAYRCDDHGLDFGAELVSDTPSDCAVRANLSFRYPVLRPLAPGGDGAKARQLVILLHGLNERSYGKYVPWAYQLMAQTGAAVALMPLSFHVDRVEPLWARRLKEYTAHRQAVPRNEEVHGFNSVLSERLDGRPERFFWGGLQSYGDVVDLVKQVRAGEHPLVDATAQVDLVGYSAGGYLALGLMLANPEGLFTHSRAVPFAAGAVMRSTHLSTRFIMDLACEVSLMKLFVRFTARLGNPRLLHWLAHHEEGRWFRALFGEEAERPRLEARLKEIAPRLLAIANTNDAVIPASVMINTLQGLHRDTGVRVEPLALGVHEHPFVCPDYQQRDRRFVTEFVDEAVYGAQFERFVALLSEHLA